MMALSTQVPITQSDRPLHTDWDSANALREGFTASHYVYSCIQLLAKEMARPDWVLQKRGTGKGKERQWETLPDSDFEELMRRPNPYQSGLDLIERGAQHLYLTGNMLILKVRGTTPQSKGKPGEYQKKPDRGPVLELWNLQPDQIKPVPSRFNFLSHYEYTAPGSGPICIDPDDIIHVMFSNPMSPFWGASPLKAMARVIDTEVDALNWWRWSIRNRAAKDGFIKYSRLLTDDEYTKIKRQLVEQVTGPWNARLPMILTGDADWVATSSSAVEMDFVELRKMTREEICGVFGVPPMLVGIMDNSTYNNMREARLSLWQDNLVGSIDRLQAAFDLQLLSDFVKSGDLRNYRTACDLSRIPALLAHLAALADSAEKFWNMGVPFNECNVRFGLGFRPLPAEVGDVSWINGQPAENSMQEDADEPVVSSLNWDDLMSMASGNATNAGALVGGGDKPGEEGPPGGAPPQDDGTEKGWRQHALSLKQIQDDSSFYDDGY
jgi:phage portal protein BeeE